jgi:hypothetical protein
MPDLNFFATGAGPSAHAVTPAIVFRLRMSNTSLEHIHNISLRCQVRIESPKRRYAESEQSKLVDLFGGTSRWGETLRSLLWANANIVATAFDGETEIELPVACTCDFNVAVTKYFDALESGEVPLLFLFSGTIFYADASGALRVEQIPWNKECTFRLPVATWKDMMATHYPNTAWLCLRKDIFDRLHAYKMHRGIPTWEQTFESFLS